jgi:hypothetical protein
VGAVIFGLKSYTYYPLANQVSILSRAHMVRMIIAAWEDEVVKSAATTLVPSEQGLARLLENLELRRSFGFLLHYDGTITNPAAGNNVADADLDDIATAQLAIDREVKERSVRKTSVLAKIE